ncbi:MAG: response regulator [Candidatus Desulforudaceae bacterium]|jgi:DNA-binding response OmpR family regulator|nr:response regulator transcription factor [Eubacteriales bacterium]
MPTILVVDDEQLLVKGLKRSLEQEGYRVLTAHDGVEALQVFQSEAIDLVVLDVMLPGLGGLEVCARIRREKETPIIMLTAKGEDVDRIVGLELGADDYVVKPFNTRELVARIRAVLRRARATDHTAANGIMEIQGLTIDGPKRKVYVRGVEVDLTAKEFDMLHLIVANPGRVYTRENLLEAVWGSAYYSDLRTVDVHIRRLREKIEENPAKPEWVLTKWGVGYYFKEKM